MIRIEGLTKSFGAVTAVNDVSLSLPQGQMIGIIGRSGAGKSTLLRLINRLVEPTAGSILYEKRDICRLRGKSLLEWRAQCAMIFQQFNLVNRLNVITNVLVGRLGYQGTLSTLLKRFPASEKARAILALNRLGIDQLALQRAENLSGGQQQRVAIAKALVQEPKILLADEPIASLDPRNAEKVMEALLAINQEYGITVLCNLHHLDTARHYCTRIIGMTDGKVVFDGPARELTNRKAGQIYGIDGSRESLQQIQEIDEQHSVVAAVN